MKRKVKLLVKVSILGLLVYLIPRLTIFYILCGLYDVSRNRPLNVNLINSYFFSKGIFLWILSPFNILMDILSLPYLNKKIYTLDDLPSGYQDELNYLIKSLSNEDIENQLKKESLKHERSMIFFKWYLKNIQTNTKIDTFHQRYRYITTIGVSTFNKKVSTSAHFGPLRASLRVLYNINNIEGKEAYIQVGDIKNYWSENKLFIFDDTLLHQSFNKTDKLRYCLFVDIIRPSYIPWLLRVIVRFLNLTMSRINGIFYKNWKKIDN